jgi:P-type Cu+ transporter
MFTTSDDRGLRAGGPSAAKVASVVAVAGHDDGAVLALAACLASGLAPALTVAIVAAARERDIRVEAMDEVDGATPAGIAAAVNGRSVLVGNAALFNELDVSLESLGDGPERLRRRGEHVMFVSIDGQVAGFFGVVRGRN